MRKFAIGKDADQNIIYINDRVKFFAGEYAKENELEVILVDFFLNEVKDVQDIKLSNCLSLIDRATGKRLPKQDSIERLRQNDERFAMCRVIK